MAGLYGFIEGHSSTTQALKVSMQPITVAVVVKTIKQNWNSIKNIDSLHSVNNEEFLGNELPVSQTKASYSPKQLTQIQPKWFQLARNSFQWLQ